MDYSILPSGSFKSVLWSGGTTSELFIYPETADYRKRDFQFRISTATVETETSDFTSLPGVSRILMLLDGEITICHEGHYSRQLNKFDTDEFPGDWKTSSVGKCIDFNLMTRGKTTGKLNAIAIEKDQDVNYSIEEHCDWFFIYAYSGKAAMSICKVISALNTGDLLKIKIPDMREFRIKGIDGGELVICEIFFR
jgi:environmental stress-induced protein Ves